MGQEDELLMNSVSLMMAINSSNVLKYMGTWNETGASRNACKKKFPFFIIRTPILHSQNATLF